MLTIEGLSWNNAVILFNCLFVRSFVHRINCRRILTKFFRVCSYLASYLVMIIAYRVARERNAPNVQPQKGTVFAELLW